MCAVSESAQMWTESTHFDDEASVICGEAVSKYALDEQACNFEVHEELEGF